MSKHQKSDRRQGMSVEVRGNDVPKALRRLKKMLADDGLFQTLRQRQGFESNGTKKRKAKKAAISRRKKDQLKSDN
jgi:ribosomal protein S21